MTGHISYSFEETELWEFEKNIYAAHDFFRDYLVSEGAWVISNRHPAGAVRNPELYNILIKKYSALQKLRNKKFGIPEKTAKKFREIKNKLFKVSKL